MEYQKETFVGFQSILTFKCKVCNIKSKLYTENPKTVQVPINKATVHGCQAIGIGHTQLSELFSFLEIPSLSISGYTKVQENVADIVHATAWDEIKKAGEEEKKMALECGDIDVDGTPVITVVADGQWSKRSYRTKYDALSGAATIIGFKSKKVLFVGIRNKYCCICQKSKNSKKVAPDHQCFLNWKKSSTSMEADGVVEGFMKSEEMHGLKYNCLIGDGDSSVTKRLNEIQPYGPNFHIRKIECRNHLMRNYATKLTVIARNTKYPLRVRKYILSNILRFRGDITKAVIHWRNIIGVTKLEKIKGIQRDVANAPYHRLGQHLKCDSYFCNGSKNNDLNLVPEAESSGMMNEIKNYVSRLVLNSESLLENKNNNMCEQFNSLINKHIAGKRLNFSSKRSYNTRVEAAVVSFNSKQYLRKIHKKISNCSPGKFGKRFIKNYERIRTNTLKRRQLFPEARKTKIICTDGPDADYGLAEPLTNQYSPQDFEKKKKEFLTSLENADIKKIEDDTRNQSESEKWYYERKKRITASRFGQVCKMRSSTSCKNTVYNILYAGNVQSKYLQYGRDTEPIARKKAECIIGEKIQICGLIVDPDEPYLAASPDGLIGKTAIIEIKCPYIAKDTSSAIDAINKKLLPYCNIVDNCTKLKKDNIYYYQVMGQLHITRRKLCYFVIYTSNWITVEKIYYEPEFWTSNMAEKLKMFYMDCMLPEIIQPLYPIRMLKSDIKEPERIIKIMTTTNNNFKKM
ncbi:uncharacterized protein LOC132950906 [Metopolophium dirhodum]|uniref:uncharacterized protein LOC132933521 n=3 Tax=Metopolophium dirhodum TaxID=44670 RepID=UPI002990020A|nr:uncharacterized protein LOC132933521 [Metopolophium dirhodum]XP_060855781.1 uncharacterized protein LOC132933521 [Metopolophium dirhodum]XP_060857404.1 uncharacterized protein LOC132934986 [Metopolophium dirhodum]XP_060857405.1 uncharacterized protein LOC132934986 [Metopolophium dirhodum]XP_060858430.1 uncharacterized protein LOC132935820 [Metopolophium dirhodum]XP_060858431.1 uncharacterized protein LOC132935820 [Metopolophium dirhodum]XP_060858464.1 uncharacterized protein LOC132935850 [